MNKLPLGTIVAVSVAAITAAGTHYAAAQATAVQTDQQLEKENAALRARIRHLELQNDNMALRAKLERLEGRDPQAQPAQAVPSPAPQRTAVAAAPVATNGVPAAALNNLYDAHVPVPVYKAAPPIAYYNWTGFYIGGNVGYSVGNDRASANLVVPGVVEPSGADAIAAPNGVIGGGQLGYNWQGGPNWLFGVEADFQGSQENGTGCLLECNQVIPGSAAITPSQITLTAKHQLDYFGTVRGRVGFVNDDTLFYVTGGGAYGRVEQTVAATFQSGASGTFSSATSSQNKFGFVVGGGIEAALGGNWTGKVEYLYMDLGNISSMVAGNVPPAPLIPFTLSATSSLHDNIIRAGFNYRFGTPAPAAVYDAYMPVPGNGPLVRYAWTGPYVGANIGYSFGNDPVSQTLTSGGAFPIVGPSTTNATIAPNGLVGGAQLGYNWQPGARWLVGVEADFQGTSQTDNACGPLVCFNQTSAGVTSTNFITVQQQLDYFGTLRGRVGLVNNNTLFYATGGAAFGHVTETVAVNSSLSSPSIFASNTSSADLIGFAVGGGIETALWSRWTGKLEYLYMDLGSISNTVDISSPGTPANVTTNSSIRDHIVRFGANYHL